MMCMQEFNFSKQILAISSVNPKEIANGIQEERCPRVSLEKQTGSAVRVVREIRVVVGRSARGASVSKAERQASPHPGLPRATNRAGCRPMSDLRSQINSLSPAEKAELLDTVWESLEADAVSLTDAQRAELDFRIARHERNPSDVIPWEQVRADLFKKP